MTLTTRYNRYDIDFVGEKKREDSTECFFFIYM